MKLVLLVLLGTMAVAGGAVANPLTKSGHPDPTVWRDETGHWYLTSTSGKVLESADGVTWKLANWLIETKEEKARIHRQYRWTWAPDVVQLDGQWRYYVSYVSDATNSAIAAYSGASARGPFTYVGILTDSRETGIKDTIDPEVVRDPETGKTWLFYGSTGRIHRLELTSDGLRAKEGAKPILVGGLSDEGVPNRLQVFEGTYLYRRAGWWYLFASRGWYRGPSYGIVVARSRTLEGEFVDKKGRLFRDGFATPILTTKKGDPFFGPGHNGEIFTDADGRDWMYYHCHVKGADPESRPVFRQQIFWATDGWPYFGNGGHPCE